MFSYCVSLESNGTMEGLDQMPRPTALLQDFHKWWTYRNRLASQTFTFLI